MNRPRGLTAACVAAAALVAACSGTSTSDTAERAFCDGHVTGAPSGDLPGPHITWTAMASTDSLERVVARYRAKHGPPAKATPGGGASWELPSGATRDVLNVSPVTEPGPWTTCDIPAGTKTIVMTSSMTSAQ